MLAQPAKPINGIRVFQRQPNGIIVKKSRGLSPNKSTTIKKVEPSINWDALTTEDKKRLIELYKKDDMQKALKIVHKITSKDFCVGCGGYTALRIYLSQQVPKWSSELKA